LDRYALTGVKGNLKEGFEEIVVKLRGGFRERKIY